MTILKPNNEVDVLVELGDVHCTPICACMDSWVNWGSQKHFLDISSATCCPLPHNQ